MTVVDRNHAVKRLITKMIYVKVTDTNIPASSYLHLNLAACCLTAGDAAVPSHTKVATAEQGTHESLEITLTPTSNP